MTSRKCLAVFLILLLLFPMIPLVHAGGPDAPIREHPWEEVKKDFPPPKPGKQLILAIDEICPFFLASPIYYPYIRVLVIEKNFVEESKKNCTEITRSLPRKK